jgi:hypothetical protein
VVPATVTIAEADASLSCESTAIARTSTLVGLVKPVKKVTDTVACTVRPAKRVVSTAINRPSTIVSPAAVITVSN